MSILKFCPSCNVTKANAQLKASIAATGIKYKKEDVLEFNKGFLWGIKPKDGGEYKVCPFCGTEVVNASISQEDFETLEDASNCNRQLLEAMIKLHDTDIIEYELKMSQFRIQVQQQEQMKKAKQEANIPKCPTCGSTNIKKIGTLERAGSVYMLGMFSKKINKSFKCEKCGMTW
jgi:hypothetical protein